ncbi:MAG: MATE family efflux transporter [Ruminococcaceae bacterium]|nr:MATE family efflux transporter [Oscillospiraceae bacterium]
MEQSEKYIQMTTAPVGRLIGKLAVPTVITMLITSIYNMADTFFVGLLDNTSATGAVGVVFSFMAIIQACGFLFGQGSGNYISRALGRQEREKAEKMASVGFYSSILAGLLIAVLGTIFLDPLCRVLGATETILPYARNYLRIILMGAPYMTAALTLNNQLRFQGAAFYSMIGIGSGGVLNILLDPLFIFTFEMGVTGAAVATVISQAVSFLLLLFGTFQKDNLRVRPGLFRPKWADFAEMLRGGFPSLCRQGLSSLSTIVLNLTAGGIGQDAAIAAMSVAGRVMHMAFAAILGFGQGFQPVCGFNYGAGLYHRVKEAFWFCVRLGTCLLLVASVAGFVFAPELVSLFSSDPQVLEYGRVALRLQCVSFPLMAWTVMCTMLTQTIGRVVPASFLSMARQGLFFIPLVAGLPLLIRGLLGVQMAQPLSDLLTAAVSVPVYLTVARRYLQEP